MDPEELVLRIVRLVHEKVGKIPLEVSLFRKIRVRYVSERCYDTAIISGSPHVVLQPGLL